MVALMSFRTASLALLPFLFFLFFVSSNLRRGPVLLFSLAVDRFHVAFHD